MITYFCLSGMLAVSLIAYVVADIVDAINLEDKDIYENIGEENERNDL